MNSIARRQHLGADVCSLASIPQITQLAWLETFLTVGIQTVEDVRRHNQTQDSVPKELQAPAILFFKIDPGPAQPHT